MKKTNANSGYQHLNRKLSAIRVATQFLVIASFIILSVFNAKDAAAQTDSALVNRPTVGAIDRIMGSTHKSLREPAVTPQFDQQVVPSSYNKGVEVAPMSGAWSHDDIQAIAAQASGLQNHSQEFGSPKLNFVEREKSAQTPTQTPKKQNLGQLISNLGMNLAFVLFIGVGIVVLAKQWIKPKSKSQDSDGQLRVTETLSLDGRSTLRVIQWKSSQILVASDAQGVKAMVPLSSFAGTLDDVEAELSHQEVPESREVSPRPASRLTPQPTPQPQRFKKQAQKKTDAPGAIDDRLIQMLLDSANRAAASKSYSSKG